MGLLALTLFSVWASNGAAQDALGGGSSQAIAALEQRLAKLIELGNSSFVAVHRYRSVPDHVVQQPANPLRPRMARNKEEIPTSFGAGVILRNSAGVTLVLTSAAVVQGGPEWAQPAKPGAPMVQVTFKSGRRLFASIYALDPRSGLATLRLNLPAGEGAALPPLALYDGEPLKRGEFVVTLGNPYLLARDGSASAAWGMVSNVTRQPWQQSSDIRSLNPLSALGSLMQIDSRLPIGQDGGAVLSMSGKLAGICVSEAAIEGLDSTAGFVLPIDRQTNRVIHSLLEGREVDYGFIGIVPETVNANQLAALIPGHDGGGVAVNGMLSGSPADQAGLTTSDLILGVNGVAVRSSEELMRAVGLMAPEEEVVLRCFRSSERKELTIRMKLAKWPVRDDEGVVASNSVYPAWRGLVVDYPSSRWRWIKDQFRFPAGVVVSQVVEGSAVSKAGILPGEYILSVDGREVSTPKDFLRATDQQTGAVRLMLDSGRTVVVSPP